ncbi:hypothetical protein HH214_10415 [Mucilaginibacter robiniae]|uniref:YtxH domain-containing protein n=1 Tax=Mucilaginibacter robiniae TaxID=2728022 RepID=A0A7L5E107_9SPHI|nr:YtxH domain-containing protein [Mucilaginibacter robiniae]QJD96188.1 hypothetical protein HH214_10075 [Mucilaginibacter robiniae]QJD96248.1 hypothetical protein HH214_10415 [Mucilaginibacter robiniae]
MKNPFEKEDHTVLISSIAIGALVAGGLAYLYLTENGRKSREAIGHKIKDEAKDLASGVISGKTGIGKDKVKKVADFVAE